MSLRRVGAATDVRIVVLVLGERKIEGGLQVEPKSRIDIEKAAEPDGRVGGHAPPLADDIADAIAGNSNRLREPARAG